MTTLVQTKYNDDGKAVPQLMQPGRTAMCKTIQACRALANNLDGVPGGHAATALHSLNALLDYLDGARAAPPKPTDTKAKQQLADARAKTS